VHSQKRSLPIFVFSLSLLTLFTTQAFAQTNPNFLTYQNPTQGIKMQYPSSWMVSQNGLRVFSDIVGFYAPFGNLSDVLTGGLILSIRHYSQNITLDGYNTLINNSLKQPGVQIIESNPSTLAGNPAHTTVFLASSGSGIFKIETMLVWTVKGNNVYAISFNSEAAKYPTYVPIVQKMINTFEIANSTTTK
jgi:eukaryotic-like serine/threonine-protein kinase